MSNMMIMTITDRPNLYKMGKRKEEGGRRKEEAHSMC